MKLSDCCGALPLGDLEEFGLCSDCKDHATFYDEDAPPPQKRGEFSAEQEAIIAELMKPCCAECGDPVARFSDGGTLHHQHKDGTMDYETDSDHAPWIKEG